jgi:hypothetical protein
MAIFNCVMVSSVTLNFWNSHFSFSDFIGIWITLRIQHDSFVVWAGGCFPVHGLHNDYYSRDKCEKSRELIFKLIATLCACPTTFCLFGSNYIRSLLKTWCILHLKQSLPANLLDITQPICAYLHLLSCDLATFKHQATMGLGSWIC